MTASLDKNMNIDPQDGQFIIYLSTSTVPFLKSNTDVYSGSSIYCTKQYRSDLWLSTNTLVYNGPPTRSWFLVLIRRMVPWVKSGILFIDTPCLEPQYYNPASRSSSNFLILSRYFLQILSNLTRYTSSMLCAFTSIFPIKCNAAL